MRKIRDILRLRLAANLSIREISASTKVSIGAIQKLLVQAKKLGLPWPLPKELDEESLAKLFYPGSDSSLSSRLHAPDWGKVKQELSAQGVTLQLLWEEYTRDYPNRCYSYSHFCALYQEWRGKQQRSMRQVHKAGEKCFVDYAGQTMEICDPITRKTRKVQVFVGVMGASSYTYAEATESQGSEDWLSSHTRMLEFFGGCPQIIVPDQLKSGVSRSCRYDPDINVAYQQWAEHYQVAIVPARPRKPKDKSKAEVGVQIVERSILARLRKETFFSLHELNQRIRSLLLDLNEKPFQKLPGNRKQAFEKLDSPELKPLPKQPYRYFVVKTVKVNIDYHVEYQRHHYSVPHQYVGERLELHALDKLVCLYFRGQRVACHRRATRPGMTTESNHMPIRHYRHAKWSPERLKKWAFQVGVETSQWVEGRLNAKAHPEQAYRICLGLLNLSRQYAPKRLESACRLANQKGLFRLHQIKSILLHHRDNLPDEAFENEPVLKPLKEHEHVRGPQHFS